MGAERLLVMWGRDMYLGIREVEGCGGAGSPQSGLESDGWVVEVWKMEVGVQKAEAEVWKAEVERQGLECPLTSTPLSEKQHPDAVLSSMGLNLIKSNSAVWIC